MKLVAAVVIFEVFLLRFSNSTSSSNKSICETIYLLNVVPYPDNSTFGGWDRGFELIPAGHLAARHINNNDSNILQGYKIEIVDVASEACGRSLIVDAVVEYYNKSLNPCVYGVVGLYCSTVTNSIAPLANHPNMGYVQLAASTSPLHRNVEAFPFTFHTISSSRVFNEAMLAMMGEFGWKRVNIVFDSLGVSFISNAVEFVNLLKSDPQKTYSRIPIQPALSSILTTFNAINNAHSRIGYFSASNGEIATFFCEAYKKQYLWPGYVYILQERSLQQIYDTEVDCSPEELAMALEGTFLFQYRLLGPQRNKLVFGLTFEQYHSQYVEELERFAEATGMKLESNNYANVLYDQVWAFALAASMSMDVLDFINSSISQRFLDHLLHVRNVLANNLRKVQFRGASGFIKFGNEQEATTSVKIYQVQNGSQVLVGEYDARSKYIEFFDGFDSSTVPADTFEVHYKLIPKWVGLLTLVFVSALLLTLTLNTIFIVTWKDRPEIKSGSHSLSLIILFGCFALSISPVFSSILSTFIISNPTVFTVLCNLQLWTFMCGNFLIFVTLFLRLLRVFHVFRSFRTTGKYWSDRYLVLYIALMFSAIVILLVIWTLVDTYRHVEETIYISTGHPPYYLIESSCYSNSEGVWLAVSFSMIGLVMAMLVFLAVQTRHIKRKHFKDTKKVNIFIFSVCIVYAIFLSLWIIFSTIGMDTVAFVSLVIPNLAAPILCHTLLFLPKIIPAIRNRNKRRTTLTGSTIISPTSSKLSKFEIRNKTDSKKKIPTIIIAVW